MHTQTPLPLHPFNSLFFRTTWVSRNHKGKTNLHPFNGPLSGTTWMSRYQKSKTNLDFTEARDSEWQWHQLSHMQVGISLQKRKVSYKCIVVCKVATPQRELTCHMGSHSVTCHPAEVTFPRTPAEAGTRLSDPGGMQG